MPYRRRNVYRRRKRSLMPRRKLYRRRYPRRYAVPRLLTKITAPRIRVLLEYNRDFTLADTSPSTPTVHTFRLNSLFDPDQTGTGGQCSGFDEWSTFYQKYLVYGCKVTVSAANKTSDPSLIIMWPSLVTPVTALDSETARQQYGAYYRMLAPVSGGDTKVISKYYAIHKLYGVSRRAVFDSDDFKSLTSNSPANQAYIVIMVDSAPTSGSYDVTYNIKMSFYCELSSRQQGLDD